MTNNYRLFSIIIVLTFIVITVFEACSKKDEPIVPNPPKPPTGSKPVAAFIADKTLSIESEVIQFTDQSTNTPTSWSWDFGDGNTSTSKNPSHTYSTKGKYSVKLIATNQFGAGTLEKADYVNVIREVEVGVSEAFVDLDFTTGTVDNYDLDAGTTTISFSDTVPDIVKGTVLTVDMDTMGYLRKVVSSQVSGNTVTLETEQALLQDVFVDRDFNLSTEMIEPNRALKSSSSNKEVSLALTDIDGYIHPAEIIYHQKDGSIIKHSALNFKSSNTKDGYKVIDFTHDFSNTDLYGKQGDDVHLYINEGEASLTSNAFFEFDFDYSGELTADTKVKKGDIKSFKFYLESHAGFLAKLVLDMQKEYAKEEEKKLVNNLVKITVKFLIGPVPFWISFDVDIYGGYSLNASASLNADWGFESNHTLTVGGTYVKSDNFFTTINEYEPENIIYPLNVSGDVNLSARFELYPKIGIKFYSVIGPYADIVPYLEGAYEATLQSQVTSSGTESFLAWNSSLDLGLDFRVGLSLIGLEPFDPKVIDCFKDPLWSAPHKIELTSELPEEAATGSTVPLTFKVYDLLGNSIPLCPIYITGNGSFSKEISFTDTNGEVNVNWVIESTAKENSASATIYNADKTIIDQLSISVIGKEAETNLINGLVAYYPFNGNANDESGNSNNGSVNGATLSTDRFGNADMAYLFDGDNDYIEIDHSESLNINEQISISFWAKLETSAPYYFPYHIIEKFGCWSIGQREDDISWIVVTDNSESVLWSSNYYYNQWYHIVMKYDGADVSIYVNGQLSSSKAANGLIKTNNNKVYISRYNFDGDYYFDGKLDDFRIYNRSINDTEIIELYNEESTEITYGTVTDSRDGKTYKTVVIGDQTWFAENLVYLPSVGPSENSMSRASYYYVIGYQGSDINAAKATDNYKTYGVLYNWPAAMAEATSSTTNPSGVQGACPNGWHLPSDDEWKQLEVHIGMSEAEANSSPVTANRGTDEGKKLKSTSGWYNSGNGTDVYGFNALPGGKRNFFQDFERLEMGAYFWSSSKDDIYYWSRAMGYGSDYINRYHTSSIYGYSIRCVKD